ncbi:MAG: DNA (cytosine-5-)-methyltransferase [Chloroflexota bacterium]|nr:DNA (cytosine-5-)-methyltransferase [Chloroflexota bacterium]
MAKDVLVRNIPDKLSEWIDQERQQYQLSQQDFLIDILSSAMEVNNDQINYIETPRLTISQRKQLPFKFIDLFAGVGGFRLALENLGGKCVFSSEWDKFSQKTYSNWFGEIPTGDITKIDPKQIPDHDILTAGFPCQPFSIAGVSKKNSLGQKHGFRDKTQGTLFFNLANIIETKRPPILILENVKNLLSHDKGKTWQVISETLEDLKYHIFYKVIDAAGWVPQHRERIFIIGFDKLVFSEKPDFKFPESNEEHKLRKILEESPDEKYTLSDRLWKYLQEYAEKHRRRGNGFGYGIADPDGITRTLSARYYKDGSEILLEQNGKNPRRLTPRECARLMGFPDELPIVVSDTQAYRQFGNAVCPLVVEAIGQNVLSVVAAYLNNEEVCLLK